MANVVVVGAQWGDEGKGKIVDWLSERADVIARFQGGHNAGHTLVIGDTVFKLSLLPSGIVRAGKLAVIGNGVVLDPWALFSEIDKLAGQGVIITPDNLQIAETCPLILPFHRDLDGLVVVLGILEGPVQLLDQVGGLEVVQVHLPVARHERDAVGHQSSSTASPGSSLPSRYSRLAPPPVEMCPKSESA